MRMPDNSLKTSSYHFFKGAWTFSRDIKIDNGITIYGTATGHASFDPKTKFADCNTLIYSEKGILTISQTGMTSTFHRSFRYVFANNMTVYFNDGVDVGKLYQEYRLDKHKQTFTASCTHLCVQDNYNAEYRILDEKSFRLTQSIQGPKKDFLITTDFQRSIIT
ncbi:MAG: hypothetical protein JST70_17315 [Bacteroidetes bacterium]|nr:hypothetical protein [Bacteroidota bacterium]